MTWNPATDAWLSGFIDGEGSFLINRQLAPRFHLGIRADDLPVLEQIQAALGGSIYVQTQQGNSKPRVVWSVYTKADLHRLMDYLDEFPPRARKAADYAIWRRAVLLLHAKAARGNRYKSGGKAERAEEMAALREALIAVRRYEELDPDDAMPADSGIVIVEK